LCAFRVLDPACGCGNFLISYEAIEVLTRENKYLLSAVCRNWTGNPIPTILTDNINSLIKQAPRLGIAEQMDALLDLVAQKTAKLGDCSSFNTLNDYPLLSFRGRDEAEFLISALIQRHHIAAARVNDFETHAHGVY